MRTLCHFKRVTKEKASNVKTLTELQNCFTTKDTKSTKGSKDKAVDPALEVGDIAQPIIVLYNALSLILRSLRTLRGEFSLAVGVCRLDLEPTANSCLPRLHRQANGQGT